MLWVEKTDTENYRQKERSFAGTAGLLFIAEQKSFYYNKRKTEMRRGEISEARYARREEGTEDVPGKYGSVGRNHEDEPVQGF